jgi:hypothetical protein
LLLRFSSLNCASCIGVQGTHLQQRASAVNKSAGPENAPADLQCCTRCSRCDARCSAAASGQVLAPAQKPTFPCTDPAGRPIVPRTPDQAPALQAVGSGEIAGWCPQSVAQPS